MAFLAAEQEKPIIFSGIQPTGSVTLGNYLGALSNWVKLQEDHRCCYCIVDLHALTVRQDPAAFKKNTLSAYALMLACGVDPEKSVAFIQSHVPAHGEMAWILGCFTQFGELSRMTQFKDKSRRHPENVNSGLFTYPILMAADILLYQAALVPVGADQKQHLELARDIAGRFNAIHGDVFTAPEGYIPQSTAKIMSLTDPTKKMSKSDDNPRSFITLLDPPEVIMKKCRSAVTDSGAEVLFREDKPGVSNLMGIYAAFTGKTMSDIEKEFAGQGYGVFKQAVGEAVVEGLRPIQQEYARLMGDKAYLTECYTKGAQKAAPIAYRTLSKVYKKLGLIPLQG